MNAIFVSLSSFHKNGQILGMVTFFKFDVQWEVYFSFQDMNIWRMEILVNFSVCMCILWYSLLIVSQWVASNNKSFVQGHEIVMTAYYKSVYTVLYSDTACHGHCWRKVKEKIFFIIIFKNQTVFWCGRSWWILVLNMMWSFLSEAEQLIIFIICWWYILYCTILFYLILLFILHANAEFPTKQNTSASTCLAFSKFCWMNVVNPKRFSWAMLIRYLMPF